MVALRVMAGGVYHIENWGVLRLVFPIRLSQNRLTLRYSDQCETRFWPPMCHNPGVMGVAAVELGREADRRRWQRLPFAVPVFLRGKDERGKEFLEFTSAINISLGGALVATRRYFPVTSEILVEIPSGPVPGRVQPVPPERTLLEARIVRVAPSDRNYLCGLQFKSLPA